MTKNERGPRGGKTTLYRDADGNLRRRKVFLLTEEEVAKLHELAYLDGVTEVEVVRRALELYFAKREEEDEEP